MALGVISGDTPRFGICLFIAMLIARVSFAAITPAVLPFLIPMIATPLLITFFPLAGALPAPPLPLNP